MGGYDPLLLVAAYLPNDCSLSQFRQISIRSVGIRMSQSRVPRACFSVYDLALRNPIRPY